MPAPEVDRLRLADFWQYVDWLEAFQSASGRGR
jgi:hypothetical protein